MIESSVVAVLLANAGVTAIVGDRITPVAVRGNALLPGITFARQSGSREYSFGGGVEATVFIGITCWSPAYPQARSGAEAARAALDKYGGGDIDIIAVTDGSDLYDPEADVFGCTIVAQVIYTEA